MSSGNYTFWFLLFFAFYLSIQGWKLFGLYQTDQLTGGAFAAFAFQTLVCVGAFLWVRRALGRRETP